MTTTRTPHPDRPQPLRRGRQLPPAVAAVAAASILAASCGLTGAGADRASPSDQAAVDDAVPAAAVARASDDPEWQERVDELNQLVAGSDPLVIHLGDSIVEGWNGRPEWAQLPGADTALNLGVGGDTTANLLHRLENGNVDGLAPEVAVVMIGSNNTESDVGGVEADSAGDIAAGVTAVVRALQERLPGTTIVLMGVPPQGDDPQIASGLTEVNRLIARLDADPHLDVATLVDLDSLPTGTSAEDHDEDGESDDEEDGEEVPEGGELEDDDSEDLFEEDGDAGEDDEPFEEDGESLEDEGPTGEDDPSLEDEEFEQSDEDEFDEEGDEESATEDDEFGTDCGSPLDVEPLTMTDTDGIVFIDLGPAFSSPDGGYAPALYDDPIHPGALGYRVWAEALAPVLAGLVSDDTPGDDDVQPGEEDGIGDEDDREDLEADEAEEEHAEHPEAGEDDEDPDVDESEQCETDPESEEEDPEDFGESDEPEDAEREDD